MKLYISQIAAFGKQSGLICILSLQLFLTACGGGGGEPELNNAVEDTNTGGGSGGTPGTGVSFILGSGPVIADGVNSSIVTIGLYDNAERPIVGVIPTFSATDTDNTNTYLPCTPTDSSGLSTCQFTSTKAEDKVLQLETPDNFSGNTISFVHGPADHITLINPLDPAAVAGSDLNVQPLFEIRDQFENVVTSSNHTLTLAPFTDASCTTPGGGTLNATTNPIVSGGASGVFTYSNVNYTQAGTLYIAATASVGTPIPPALCLGPITVSNNFTYHLSFEIQPSGTATAGQKFGTQPEIHILDQFNNLALTGGVDTNAVTVAAFTDSGCTTPAAGTLQGSLTENASGAIVNTFNLDYTRAPETIYLRATSPGITEACSDPISMSPATPDAGQSTIAGTGPVAANGFHFSTISISILDPFSNPIQGVTPTFSATDTGTDNVSTACSLTDATGSSTCELRSNTTELKTLVLTSPVVKADGTVNFINPPDPANTTIVGTQATADLVDTSTITVTMLDASSNPVVGIAPTFLATDTGTTNIYQACTTSDGSGVSTCGLQSSAAELKTLTITSPMNNFVGGTADFVAGAPSAANSNITGTTNIIADGVATSTVTITIRDTFNNPVSGITPTFSATDTGSTNSYSACSLSDASGQSSCSFSSTVAENKTLQIDTPFVRVDDNVDFIPGPVGTLVFTQQPSSAVNAGVVFAQQPMVQIQDAFGNIRTTDTSGINLAAFTDATCTTPAGGTLGATNNPQAANGTSGEALFAGVNYDTAGFIYLRAELSGVTTCSNVISVSPAAAAQLAFIQQPTNTDAAQSISPAITVQVQDTFGNHVPTATDSITLSFGTDASGGTATLAGTLTVAASGGLATFNDINIDIAATGYTLQANSGILTSATSSSFDINVGVPAQLAFDNQPSTTIAGSNIAPAFTVNILDAGGNQVTTATDNVTLSFGTDASGGTATLAGTLTVAAVAGVATFSDINIDIVGTSYTLDADSGLLTTGTSSTFDILPGAPAKLAFVQEPTDTISTVSISPAITVNILDSFDNHVTSATDNVTLAFNNDASGGSATLGGTLTVAAVAGVATFNDINIDSVATGYTFDATSGALSSATSASFDILVGTPDHLVITQEPTNTVAGVSIAPAITVEVRDIGNNLVPTATDNITLIFNNDASTGTATLGGTLTVAAVGGVATFNDINIDKAFTGYTLDATATGLTLATSASFDITPAAASQVAFATEPSDAAATDNITPAITVNILDAFENIVTTSTDNVSLAFNNDASGGTATLGGTLTVAAVGGVATFSDINIDVVGTGYTLDATSGALALDTSSAFNITANAATQVVFTTDPVNTVAGVSITPAMTVEFRDAGNNLVSTETSNVTLAFNNDASGGTATLGGTLTVAAIGGVATFNDINIDIAATNYTINASSGVLTSDTSNSFDITPAAKSQLSFSVQPSNAVSNISIAPAIEVQILDAFGNLTADTDNISLTFNNDASGGSATLGGTLTVAAVGGVATFSDINIDVPAIGYTLDATAGGLATATSNIFDITSAPATQLVFVTQPSNATAGSNIAPAITVELRDASNNLVTSETSNVTLAINNDASGGSATLGGTLTVAAVGGVATFSDINIDIVGTGYTLDATSGALTLDTSSTFDITPGTATQLAFVTQPSNTVSSSNITPAITVEIQDAGGNLVTTATDNVTIAFNNDASGGSATLGGTLTVAAVGGVATFSDINIDIAGTGYTLDATSGALTLDTSSTFDITPGTATQLAFVTQPSNTASGDNITPAITVEIRDAAGNLVNTATDNVTLAFNNDASGGSATLSGTLTVAAVSGVATFSDVNIDIIGIGYTLDATSGVLTLDTSNTFDITPNTGTQLVFVVQPSNTTSGVNMTPAITVEIQDAGGNLVTTATDNVTLAFNNDASGGSATLGGTLTVAAIAGIATFNDINIDIAATGYTLDATSGVLTSDTSNAFNITPGTATQIVFTTEPSNTDATVNISPAITVEIRDAAGNVVNTATDNVTLAFNNDASGGSATLGGTLTVAAVAGVATFNDINIDESATGYTLDATSGVLTSDTSDPFDITLAPATQVVFVTQPVNTSAGANITPAITVEFRDASNNLVTSETSNVTLAFNNDASGGSATLSGTLTVAAVAGVATFNDINIDIAATGYTLDATSGVLTSDTSSAFDITAGAATQLAFVSQPSNTIAGTNIAPSITVELRDAGGNLVNTATDNVTLAFNNDASGGSATLGGTLTVAAVAGVATFSDINIDIAATGYTFHATSGALTPDTSNAFDITPAVANQLAITVQPSNAQASTNISPAIEVQIQDAFGNLTSNTDNITLALNNDASGGSATLGGTLTVAAVAGVVSFSDINLDIVATGYTLDATAAGLTTATSDPFDITAGTPAQLVFRVEPSNTQSATNISPAIEVEIQDAAGNLVTTATDNVTLAFNNDASGGSATLGGTLTVAAVAGVATFSDINIDVVGTGYTFDATSGALTLATSDPFDITPAGATQLVFTTEPTNSVAGVNIAPAIAVEFRDASNNLVSTETSNVTLSFNNDASGGSATLGGTLTVAAVAGVATFSDINIDLIGTGYTFDAASGALPNVTSDPFDITPAAASQLVFSVQPVGGELNTSLAPAIVVQIQDAFGNVTANTDTITLSLNNNPGGATLGGTLNIAAVAGEATFSDITLNQIGTGYTLDTTGGGFATVTSDPFNITGPPTQLAFSTQPSDSLSGAIISPSIRVEIQDAAGNLVTTETNTITLAFQTDPSGGSATLGGTLSLAASGGVAIFNDITVDEIFADYVLSATTGGLTSATSTPFDIQTLPPDSITLIDPATSPDQDATPTVRVGTVASGDIIQVFTNATCSAANLVASITSSGTTADLTTSALSEGVHTLYATRQVGSSVSSCSTASLTYEVAGSFNQLDSFDTNFGNWSNVGGDQGNWTQLDSGGTPSFGVGPTSGQGGAGGYLYTEASGANANDEYILESNILDGAANPLSVSFYWNKRGTDMGDLILEASNNGGTTWTQVFSHLGQDIASDNVDVWRNQFVDLCTLGYTSTDVQLRFRAIMPAGGNIFNSDIAVDEINISSGGCVSSPPANVTFDTPAFGSQITFSNFASFTVGGTCSDNGQNVVLSGDVSGTTACSGNAWSITLDTTPIPDGNVQINVAHSSSSGGADGTASRTFIKDILIFQLDNFDGGSFGNWTNPGTGDRDWFLNSGDSPSNNVGPSSGQGGAGGYAYTEASNPTNANDVFILHSNSIDTGAANMNLEFFWNKRGNTMGDLFLEISTDGGATFGAPIFQHLGADIASGDPDVWRQENIDLCALGHTSGNIVLRFRAVMPNGGAVFNSDIGIDEIKITTDGCP